VKIGWLSFIAVLAIVLPTLADSPPTLEQHAGKPILRDTPTPSAVAVPALNQQSLDLNSGQVALALLAVVGLILLLRYCTKKFLPTTMSASARQTVKVLARCPLGPHQQVLLLQVGKRILVVGDRPAAGLNCLSQITDPDEVAMLLGQIQRDKDAPVSRPFAAWFGRASEAFTDSDTELTQSPQSPLEVGDVDESSDSPPAVERSVELAALTARVRNLARQFSDSKNAG
jgi:flagellar biogenesis protein FliO